MEFKKVGIAKGRINNLEKQPYWTIGKSFYAIDIIFSDLTSIDFPDYYCINLGKTQTTTFNHWSIIRENFAKVDIKDGAEIILLYSGKTLIAIGCEGKDCWLDVKNDFAVKKFKDLNIVFSSLTVY